MFQSPDPVIFGLINNIFVVADRFVINTFTTSDSDASDHESGRIGLKKREKEAKLRLAALTLLGTVARVSFFRHNLFIGFRFIHFFFRVWKIVFFSAIRIVYFRPKS